MQKISLDISKQSLSKLLLCATVVILFIALFIVPALMEKKKISREFINAQADLERQKVLYPMYLGLKAQLDRKVVNHLPTPEPNVLLESDLNDAMRQIEQAAVDAGLQVNNVLPEPASLAKESGLLGVQCEFFGLYESYQKFYYKVGAMPALRHFERVEAQEGAEGVRFTLRLQLAIKTG
jgi:Tfp pilus assembly protein PilO